MSTPRLEVTGARKQFPGVLALDGIAISLDVGEVLAVVGENGAGKSTLMKCVAGVYELDSGEVRLDGRSIRFHTPAEAIAAGVSLIHQELNLAENLTVTDNLFLGRELTRAGCVRMLNNGEMARKATDLLAKVGLPAKRARSRVEWLSPGEKQLVEIARALGTEVRVLIMDEPTSSLTQSETERLYTVIEALKAAGVSVLYISHRLAEVKRCADRVVVLRDGRNAGELSKSEITHDNMVRLMVGRDLQHFYPKVHRTGEGGDPVLQVSGLRYRGGPEIPASFDVRAGEILGMAGLVGAGRTELAEAVFGVRDVMSGQFRLDAQSWRPRSPAGAIASGILMVPEDRRLHGLVLEESVGFNLSLPNLDRLGSLLGIRRRAEDELHRTWIERLRVKTPSARQPVGLLSGGNQQKVVYGKWLARGPRVLILDEPTRGVDVGAKSEIYALVDELAGRGIAIWMITSDMEELLGMADRVVVMHEGRIAGELAGERLTEESVMRLATGGEIEMTRVLGVLGLLVLLYGALIESNPAAGSTRNLMYVANIQGRYGVITLGAALVIITGGIDLSIGSVVGCSAILFGVLMEEGVHPMAAVGWVISFGVLVGLINGLLITRLKLQPFLVTLCGMFIYRGAARLIGSVVNPAQVLEAYPHFEGPLNSLTYCLVGKNEKGALIFPAMFVLLLALATLTGFFLHRTAYGRYWYAIGHNELAAKYAGVNVNRQRIVVYVACSTLASFGGVLLFLDSSTIQADSAGAGLELYAILGAVLGGCSLRGGEGTAIGIVLGAMVLPVLETLVSFRGLRNNVIPAVIGLTLLFGTIVDELIRRRSHKRH